LLVSDAERPRPPRAAGTARSGWTRPESPQAIEPPALVATAGAPARSALHRQRRTLARAVARLRSRKRQLAFEAALRFCGSRTAPAAPPAQQGRPALDRRFVARGWAAPRSRGVCRGRVLDPRLC